MFQVVRFSRSLEHAVSDAVAARAKGCVVYCDSNVALGLIFGADFAMQSGELDLQLWLAYALIAGGFMGPVAILRPHLVELDRAIPELAERAASGGKWWDRRERFIDTEGLRDAIEEVLKFRARINRGEEKALDGAVEFLRSAGWRGVLALELLRGEWKERLKQLSQHVLKLGSLDTGMSADLREPLTWQAFASFEGMRPNFGRNNLIDALAVSALARENKHVHSAPAVRFFTGSPTFERVVRSRADIRDALLDNAEELFTASGEQPESLILRDAHYVLVRASFQALRVGETEDGSEEPTLADLLELAQELAALRFRGTKILTLAARTLKIRDRPLLEVIEEIESLAFVGNVLVKQKVPETLHTWLLQKDHKGETFWPTDATTTFLGKRLRRRLEAFRRTVGDQQEVLRSWSRFVEDVKRGAQARIRTFEGMGEINFDRDLGVVRWGGIGNCEPSVEVEILGRLVGPDDIVRTRAAEDLVLRGVRDGDGGLPLAAVAWALGAFDVVVAVLNRYQDSLGGLPVGLNIMRTAARLRGEVLVSGKEMAEHIAALETLLPEGGSAASPRLRLGLGYVSYYAARRCGLDDEGKTWLSRSMMFGQQACDGAGTDELARAFAVNHCVYLAAQMGDSDKEWLAQLSALRDDRSVWNYRFSDTLAWRRFCRARSAFNADAAAVRDEAQEVLQKLIALGPRLAI